MYHETAASTAAARGLTRRNTTRGNTTPGNTTRGNTTRRETTPGNTTRGKGRPTPTRRSAERPRGPARRPGATPPGVAGSDQYPHQVVLAGTLLLTFAVYARTLGNEFIDFDDTENITGNYWIQELTWGNLKHFFTTPLEYMYTPLASLSFAFDYRIGELHPAMYHVTNLILHLCNVVLVFLLARALTGRTLLPYAVAVVFGIHPMNVDAVAWVATRSNLLATLFCLATMLAYLSYLRRPGWPRLLLAVALFTLAALSKTTAMALPPVLVLIDLYQRRSYWRDRRPVWRPVLDKLPFFAIATVIGLVALHFRMDTIDTAGYSLAERLIVGCTALLTYMVKAVVPAHLAMAYAYPGSPGGDLAWYLYLTPLALVAVAGALLLIRRARRLVLFGLGFFLVTILPTQFVWMVDSYTANRYAYLPYVGLFLIAGYGVEWLARRARTWRPPPRAGVLAALVAIVVAFSVVAGLRGAQWRNTETIMTASMAVEPRVPFVYSSRGIAELNDGNYDRARADFEESLRLDPNFVLGFFYLGKIRHIDGDEPGAIDEFNEALARLPSFAVGYNERGISKAALGDTTGALSDFNQAIMLDPSYIDTYYQRAVVEVKTGDYAAARADLDQVVARYPADGDALYYRGIAEDRLNEHKAACRDWQAAQSAGKSQAAQALAGCW